MTVVVVVPGHAEPWKVSNQAFRMLCRTADNQSWGDPQVTRVLTQAAALNGLHLDLLEVSEQQRVSVVLGRAAEELRAEILARAEVDEWSRSLADYLPVLQMWLEGLQPE